MGYTGKDSNFERLNYLEYVWKGMVECVVMQ